MQSFISGKLVENGRTLSDYNVFPQELDTIGVVVIAALLCVRVRVHARAGVRVFVCMCVCVC